MLGWGGFWILTLTWGSLFLFSQAGVSEIDPIHLTFIRLGTAAVGMSLVMMLRRLPIPKDPRILVNLIINGIGGLMMPIFMLNLGIQTVETGVSSVLQATAAIFAAVVAHFVFADERLNAVKLFGVIVSFIGVIVLTMRDAGGSVGESTLEGQILLIIGALFYAAFTIHSRVMMQRNAIKPTVFSAFAMLSASMGIGIVMVWNMSQGTIAPTIPINTSIDVLFAVLVLAVVHSFLCYLLYYEVVARIGASQATMVTYTIPPVALIIGIVFADEILDAYIIVGTVLIFVGIGFTKLKIDLSALRQQLRLRFRPSR